MYADLYKQSERDPFATKQDDANESRQAHYINPAGLTPENWKSSDGMYPDNRGGFSKEDRALWRKDRYNAVYGRYRDKNGDYRNKNGHMIGVDNIPLLTFNDDKPFPGWANGPGSQFHPDDHPKVDADFYRDRENWPAKGTRALALHPFEDDWDEKGAPLQSEFHDLTDLPAFKRLNQKQLPERVPMNKMFELQQQALNNQMQAAQQQPNQTANTIQQIGSLVQTAAPLVMQGLSALASAASSGGESAGGGSDATGSASGGASSVGTGSAGTSGTVGGMSNSTVGSVTGGMPSMQTGTPSAPAMTGFQAPSGGTGMQGNGAGVASPPVAPLSGNASDASNNVFFISNGVAETLEPNSVSPEGMYGPMYPEPGIMTGQPQGRITSGEPKVEASGIPGQDSSSKSDSTSPVMKPKIITNENGDFEVIMQEDSTMPPKGWSEVENVEGLDDSAMEKMGKALVLSGIGAADISTMPIRGLWKVYAKFAKELGEGGLNPINAGRAAFHLMKDKAKWAYSELPEEVKAFEERMEERKRWLNIK